jgi:hypothetical protein
MSDCDFGIQAPLGSALPRQTLNGSRARFGNRAGAGPVANDPHLYSVPNEESLACRFETRRTLGRDRRQPNSESLALTPSPNGWHDGPQVGRRRSRAGGERPIESGLIWTEIHSGLELQSQKQDVRQEPTAPSLSQLDLAPLRLVFGSKGRPNEAVTDLRLARPGRSPTARGAWPNCPDSPDGRTTETAHFAVSLERKMSAGNKGSNRITDLPERA